MLSNASQPFEKLITYRGVGEIGDDLRGSALRDVSARAGVGVGVLGTELNET